MGDSDRQKFLEVQRSLADETFEWTSGEQEARERFMQLAMDTHDFLIGVGAPCVPPFYLSPEAAGKPLRRNYPLRRIHWPTGPNFALSHSLMERWDGWKQEYCEIRVRNPRVDLRDMISHICQELLYPEMWPVGAERDIQAWVDAEDPSAPLADLGENLVTPQFFVRLRELRRHCNGWIYWSLDRDQLVFAPEPEWRRICSEQARRPSSRIPSSQARRAAGGVSGQPSISQANSSALTLVA